jgi:hypothetical protein
VTFNIAVQGDSSHLSLYVSRWPHELALATDQGAPTVSDLRRINYWLSAGGLSRQEVNVATTDDALSYVATGSYTPSDPDNRDYVIAPEVSDLQFQYFDGTSWNDSWDGTVTGPDGQTPIGPPVAISVQMDIVLSRHGTGGDERTVRTYRQVVFLPTANGTTTASSTNSSGSGSSP